MRNIFVHLRSTRAKKMLTSSRFTFRTVFVRLLSFGRRQQSSQHFCDFIAYIARTAKKVSNVPESQFNVKCGPFEVQISELSRANDQKIQVELSSFNVAVPGLMMLLNPTPNSKQLQRARELRTKSNKKKEKKSWNLIEIIFSFFFSFVQSARQRQNVYGAHTFSSSILLHSLLILNTRLEWEKREGASDKKKARQQQFL